MRADGRKWRSAILKSAVEGPVRLNRENLAGDRQCNLVHHGGPDKAVCAFASEHYPVWETFLDRSLPPGAFGENFTLSGMPEDMVCVGDVYAVGSALIQISQPRVPCANLSHRWENPELPGKMVERRQTGYYFRVLNEGEVSPGAPMQLRERPHPDWTVHRVNQFLHRKTPHPAEFAALLDLDALASPCKSYLEHVARRQKMS